ncbi:unnamed protein product [Nezara viridula]|uniref:Lipase domain-containing protein n=1 Tax=Nezara viridula TaxID=85310 RepID=A0A9P0HR20_NEZVI|nr:unnamed protein product [Nezara viridula]
MEYLSVIILLVLASSINCSPHRKWECGEDCMRSSKRQTIQLEEFGTENVVKFYLYNRNIIDGSDGYSVFDSASFETVFNKFDAKNETKIIIHGWMDNLNSNINVLLKGNYLANYSYNIIIADWSGAGSMNPVYPAARSMVPIVANQVAMLIDSLYVQFHLKPENLHLIGHSLGAHIAGVTGQKIQSGNIGRVTGLDPAGPLFKVDKPEERISNSSALFVDVIHTSGLLLGTTYQMGHADFFPNGGNWMQPGCWVDVNGGCSHARSYLYFAESINYPFGYQSTPCSDWKDYVENKCEDEETITMGAFAPKLARGSYYLKTNSEPPFFEL